MNLAIIGLGKMGEAILDSILNNKILEADQIIAADKKFSEANFELPAKYKNLKITADNKKAVLEADYIILAVKPQIIKFVLDDLKNLIASKVVISIAAGIKTKTLEKYLGLKTKIVRAMPNTPALVAEAVTALYFSDSVQADEIALVEKIFKSMGKIVRIPENKMDAVTGLSGSGPAYAYLFIEALADAGVLNGLARDSSIKLAAQTLKGAAEMVLQTAKHPAELKDSVTSPGGTTIAALAVLEENNFRSALIKAVTKSVQCSQELGK